MFCQLPDNIFITHRISLTNLQSNIAYLHLAAFIGLLVVLCLLHTNFYQSISVFSRGCVLLSNWCLDVGATCTTSCRVCLLDWSEYVDVNVITTECWVLICSRYAMYGEMLADTLQKNRKTNCKAANLQVIKHYDGQYILYLTKFRFGAFYQKRIC